MRQDKQNKIPLRTHHYDEEEDEVIIILKIGGSSITCKANEETLNEEALEWFAKLVAESIDASFLSNGHKAGPPNTQLKRKSKPQFIVVHGAGSFGHHSAKRYGLRCGKAVNFEEENTLQHNSPNITAEQRRYQMEGLSKTRQSVQKLNAATVSFLIKHGVNAVGISPGVSIPNLYAHGATGQEGQDTSSRQGMRILCKSIKKALQAGLVPVLHGDACLLYDGMRAGILGGDTITEGIVSVWDSIDDESNTRRGKIAKVIFITDVAGVFTSDPKENKNAELIRYLTVDRTTGEVTISNRDGECLIGKESAALDVSGSSHDHDVTGGLKAKLSAAASIAQSGIDVMISQCGYKSTERFVKGDYESIWDVETGTLLAQKSM